MSKKKRSNSRKKRSYSRKRSRRVLRKTKRLRGRKHIHKSMKRKSMKRKSMKRKLLFGGSPGEDMPTIEDTVQCNQSGAVIDTEHRFFKHDWNQTYFTQVVGIDPKQFDGRKYHNHWAFAFDRAVHAIKSVPPSERKTTQIIITFKNNKTGIVFYDYTIIYDVETNGFYRILENGEREYLVIKKSESKCLCNGVETDMTVVDSFDKNIV